MLHVNETNRKLEKIFYRLLVLYNEETRPVTIRYFCQMCFTHLISVYIIMQKKTIIVYHHEAIYNVYTYSGLLGTKMKKAIIILIFAY